MGPYLALAAAALAIIPRTGAEPAGLQWSSPNRYRVLLTVDPRGRPRSHSPASVEIDFARALREQGETGDFDPDTLEVVGCGEDGQPRLYDPPRPGRERFLLPHRLDRLFGAGAATLNFVVPDERCLRCDVYFDTVASRRGRPRRFAGLVGDGDRFVEEYGRREIAASHFDQFCDLDGDGDLDLFKGGVEPFVYCYENAGGSRMVPRGRLASGGRLFVLPHSVGSHRSWVTVAFYDWDGDGDLDFLPSFQDGPDAGRFILYRNTTREHGGLLTFDRAGPLRTASGAFVGGGAQAGGWFPSLTCADWDGDGRFDLLVGSNNHCYLYRSAGVPARMDPMFEDAVPIQAGGKDLALVNPRFDVADLDSDGDLDLLAGCQPGPIYWFRNDGSRRRPVLAPGVPLAFTGRYLIGDAHSGVCAADFDGDRRVDFVAGRFWERADLDHPEAPRDSGALYRNVGPPGIPRFERRTAGRGAPFVEGFPICDALRQNGVRARDWDRDGRLDLLAGDTDGFIWFFRNRGSRLWPLFDRGKRLRTDRGLLSVTATGGHARFDAADWNGDGAQDLLVADAQGSVTFFAGRPRSPSLLPLLPPVTTSREELRSAGLQAGVRLLVGGAPLKVGERASALVCDWDGDGRRDLVLAGERGYWFCRNEGTDRRPALAAPAPILFGGLPVRYVRPNLGSFVDWDGDGHPDLIGAHFENTVRLYRGPRFGSPEGEMLLQSWTVQMISGADAVDWNGDGDLDLLTGQGHGGSGLRYYERDYLEDELRGTHPKVRLLAGERKPG